MTIDIKTPTATQVILSLASKKQDELKDVSIQIASGNKHTDFHGFAEDGNVERFLSLNESLKISKSFVQSNNIIDARINTQINTVEQIQSIAGDVSELIAQARNSASGDDIDVELIGRSILDNISGRLNVRFDGRYLFSGTKTDTLPVQEIQDSNLDDDNNPTASYYYGDSEKASIKISSSQTIEYGVNANDISFQQLIAAVHLAIEGHNNKDDAILGEAVDMINEAISGLASVRAELGSSQENLRQANATHSDADLLISQNLIDISQTDIVQATTRMSELQAVVQASYLAFQRLNELRLSNFLN